MKWKETIGNLYENNSKNTRYDIEKINYLASTSTNRTDIFIKRISKQIPQKIINFIIKTFVFINITNAYNLLSNVTFAPILKPIISSTPIIDPTTTPTKPTTNAPTNESSKYLSMDPTPDTALQSPTNTRTFSSCICLDGSAIFLMGNNSLLVTHQSKNCETFGSINFNLAYLFQCQNCPNNAIVITNQQFISLLATNYSTINAANISPSNSTISRNHSSSFDVTYTNSPSISPNIHWTLLPTNKPPIISTFNPTIHTPIAMPTKQPSIDIFEPKQPTVDLTIFHINAQSISSTYILSISPKQPLSISQTMEAISHFHNFNGISIIDMYGKDHNLQ